MPRNGKVRMDALIEFRQSRGQIDDLEAQILRMGYGLPGFEELGERPGLVRNPDARQTVREIEARAVAHIRGSLPSVDVQLRMQYGRGARLGADAACDALAARLNGNSTTH